MIEKLTDDLRPERFNSLTQVFEHIVTEHGPLPAFSCFGQTLDFNEVDRLSSRFAHYVQTHTDLKPGDRIAIQLPNLLQFPVVLFGAIKAGLIVVNTNPLYTAPEMKHQFVDSGVRAIVILANFCDKLEKIIDSTSIDTVIVTQLGDLQSPVQRLVLNLGARYLKKMVPRYSLPGAVDFMTTMAGPADYRQPEPASSGDEVAIILYTGGTTGYAKGAMLSHNNLIANMMQLRARCLLVIRDREETIAAPLPLYHSYAFLLHCLAMPFAGNHNILITNPRDLDSLIKILQSTSINGFVGINTLYQALLRHRGLASVDFSQMKFCGAGGMPMSTAVALEWKHTTGCEIIEGYGLTECSPVVAVNIPGRVKLGTVGPPVPETELRVVDEAGAELAQGERGELWVRGPQVMLGYWQQEQATREAITEDGWLITGDYVEIDEDNCIRIVDRKKDMILVSGFNVFPNEIEDWVNQYPKVRESAAVGIPCEKTGEAVRLFVVPNNGSISEDELLNHCRQGLTAYKLPRDIVFVDDLPKNNIGKILRRELRH